MPGVVPSPNKSLRRWGNVKLARPPGGPQCQLDHIGLDSTYWCNILSIHPVGTTSTHFSLDNHVAPFWSKGQPLLNNISYLTVYAHRCSSLSLRVLARWGSFCPSGCSYFGSSIYCCCLCDPKSILEPLVLYNSKPEWRKSSFFLRRSNHLRSQTSSFLVRNLIMRASWVQLGLTGYLWVGSGRNISILGLWAWPPEGMLGFGSIRNISMVWPNWSKI